MLLSSRNNFLIRYIIILCSNVFLGFLELVKKVSFVTGWWWSHLKIKILHKNSVKSEIANSEWMSSLMIERWKNYALLVDFFRRRLLSPFYTREYWREKFYLIKLLIIFILKKFFFFSELEIFFSIFVQKFSNTFIFSFYFFWNSPSLLKKYVLSFCHHFYFGN